MLSPFRRVTLGAASTLLLGCTADGPTTAPTVLLRDAASLAAEQAACHSIAFTSDVIGTFPFFSGTMVGDLEGTLQILQDPTTIVAPNDIYARVDGTIDFKVTGGSIPALIGRSFRTRSSSSNRFASDVDPTLGEIAGRVRAVDGVSRVNLAFHGFVDVTDGAPPFEVHLRWHGVICP